MTELDDTHFVLIPIISYICKLYECYTLSTKKVAFLTRSTGKMTWSVVIVSIAIT